MKNIRICILSITSLLLIYSCDKNENSNPQDLINYQEFVVDTTVFSNDTVLYDIDGDQIFDLQITKSINFSESNAYYEGEFSWIKEPMLFCYIKSEPTMEMVDLGDKINSSDAFNWNSKVGYSGSTPYFSENHYWAAGIFTDYFGFQIEKDDGIHFGWFHFKHFELKEIAINRTPNRPILIGQKE